MKKLTTYGFILTLSLALVLNPALILAATVPSAASLRETSVKLTPAPRARRPATLAKAQTGVVAGQTSTLLPDGRFLIVGGQETEGAKATVAISDPRTGEVSPLSVKLHQARAWHSATMLPDGRVMVIGGKGLDNRIVESAEIIDPSAQTCELVFSSRLVFARAHHTATLLTDGRVLIAGGISATGRALNRVGLWDFKTRIAVTLAGKLGLGRQKQRATLQADGNILIEGGVDNAGTAITSSEIFNSESLVFVSSANWPDLPAQTNAYLAGSVPGNNAGNVPLDTLIGLRFSQPLDVQALSSTAIRLNGPQGALAIRIVPAEGGRLAFITPLLSLEPGTTYTVSFAGASEATTVVVPSLFSFTTAGKENGNRSEDEDWIPDASNLRGNWRSKGVSSEAQSLPPLQAEPGITALAGQVLTLNGRPLAGVSLEIGTASTQTDQTGRFLLTNLVTGHQVMRLDGRTANEKLTASSRLGLISRPTRQMSWVTRSGCPNWIRPMPSIFSLRPPEKW